MCSSDLPSNKLSSNVIKQFANYYTNDIEYLKDTQQLTKNIKLDDINTLNNKHSLDHSEINDIVSSWEEIKSNKAFCEQYLFIDWSFAKSLNNNSHFLQLMSLYNIASPIISLCLPIVVLIVPFFIIKLKGATININQYCEILKTLISNHAIFKIFTQFHEVDTNQKMYLILSSAFYLF